MADVIWADLRIATDKSKAEVQALNTEIVKTGTSAKQSSTTATAAYKQQEGVINKLRFSISKLTEMRDKSNSPGLITRYNKLIDEQNSKLKSLTATQQKQVAVTKQATAGFNDMRASLGMLAATIGVTLGVQQIVQFTKASLEAAASFEKAISELSSITGVVGQELEFYKQAAKDLSVANIGGVNITSSAEDIAKAFSLVGSAKPELLASKDAMVEVTQQALILAEASGLTLPDAVTALTNTMNQFGAPADQARQYIDALAAGAKYGAVAIPQVSEAIVKFGAAAKSSNVSVNESVALIELLGEKGLQGAEAGTALRNILIKLSNAPALGKEALTAFKAAGVDVKILADSTLPLESRLRETSKLMKVTGGLTHVFGTENQIAAQNILSNIDRYAQLNTQIGETGIAMEQAGINTDNTAAKMKQFNNQIKLIQVSLGDALAPVLLDVATGISTLLKGDFSLSGLDKMGDAIDKVTTIIQYTPQPIAGYIRGVKSLRAAFEEFRQGNILEGIKKSLEGVANVITFGVYETVKQFFTPAKKEVIEGLTAIERAGLEVASMTDDELNVALKNLAQQSGMSEEKLRELADTVKKNELLKTFNELAAVLSLNAEQFKELTKQSDKYGISARITSDAILKIRDATEQELLVAFQKQKLTVGASKEDWDEYVATIKGFKTKAEDAATAQGKLTVSTTKAAGPYDALTNSVSKAMKALQDQATLFEKGSGDWERVLSLARQYAEKQNELVVVNDLVTESLKRQTKNGLVPLGEAMDFVIMRNDAVIDSMKFTIEQAQRRDEIFRDLGVHQVDTFKATLAELEKLQEAEIKASDGTLKKITEIINKYTEAIEQAQIKQAASIAGALASVGDSLNEALGQIFGEAAEKNVLFLAFQKTIAISTITLKSIEAIANGIAALASANPLDVIKGVASLIAGIGSLIGGLVNEVNSIQAPPVPAFGSGTDSVKGGIPGKDSVPAILMPKEAVIKASENEKYPGLAKAWNMGSLEPYIMKNFAAPILRERAEQNNKDFAENVSNSLLLQKGEKFNDYRLYIATQETNGLLKRNNQLLDKNLRRNKNPWNV